MGGGLMIWSMRAGAVALALVLGGKAEAQYPTRPIQVIVPFAGGSASDVVARVLLERMGTTIGHRFVIDNRPAAGGNVGTQAAAKAEPDGYTLLFSASGPLAVNKVLYKNLGYDPESDFEPISLVAILPNIIVVNSALPIHSVAEFIAYAKSRPKQINYSSVGIGSSQHLAAAYFEQVVGLEMTHVPYRITAQLVSDLISGVTQASFQLLPNVLGPLSAGQVRPLAVTMPNRLAALPDVPTIVEAGVTGYECSAWFALLAPKGTPKPIIEALHKELAAAMADPAVRQRFTELGAQPVVTTPDELSKFISAEVVKWRGIITRGGITIDQ